MNTDSEDFARGTGARLGHAPLAAFVPWPGGFKGSLLLMAAALVLVLFLALAIDALRRLLARRKALAAEWRAAREIARKRGISEQDWDVLEGVIRRYAPSEPLRSLTIHHHFDACVEADLARLEHAGTSDRYAEHGVLFRALRTQLGLDFVPYGRALHSTRELTVGQRVWISFLNEGATDWMETWLASIEETGFSLASWKDVPGGAARFCPGQPVRCHMWREDDARYAFASTLVEFEATLPLWIVHHTADLERTQTRDYYRLSIDLPVRADVLRIENAFKPDELDRYPVETSCGANIDNLSAGGIAIRLDMVVPAQSVLRVAVQLPEQEPMTVYVRVLGSVSVAAGGNRVRGCFVGISEEARERIVHHIMQEQQRMLAADNAVRAPGEPRIVPSD